MSFFSWSEAGYRSLQISECNLGFFDPDLGYFLSSAWVPSTSTWNFPIVSRSFLTPTWIFTTTMSFSHLNFSNWKFLFFPVPTRVLVFYHKLLSRSWIEFSHTNFGVTPQHWLFPPQIFHLNFGILSTAQVISISTQVFPLQLWYSHTWHGFSHHNWSFSSPNLDVSILIYDFTIPKLGFSNLSFEFLYHNLISFNLNLRFSYPSLFLLSPQLGVSRPRLSFFPPWLGVFQSDLGFSDFNLMFTLTASSAWGLSIPTWKFSGLNIWTLTWVLPSLIWSFPISTWVILASAWVPRPFWDFSP